MFGVAWDEDSRAGFHRRFLAVDPDDAGSFEDEVDFRGVVAMRFQLAAGGEFGDAGAHAVGGGDIAAEQRVPGDGAVDGVVPSVARALFGCGDNGCDRFVILPQDGGSATAENGVTTITNVNRPAAKLRVGRLVVWRDLL